MNFKPIVRKNLMRILLGTTDTALPPIVLFGIMPYPIMSENVTDQSHIFDF